MYLEKLMIVNFKSCRNIFLDFTKDDPSVFIGANDSGKSVILGAIECLLSSSKKIDFKSDGKTTSDVSNTPLEKDEFDKLLSHLPVPDFDYNNKAVYVAGFFVKEVDDSTEIYDQKASNHLKWSMESFSNDRIVILKEYLEDKVKTYLCSKDSNLNGILWDASKAELTRLTKEFNVSQDDIQNENGKGPFKNLEILRAIYGKMDTDYKWSEYSDYPKDLKNMFPVFRYFDAKISMDDVKGVAKDVLIGKIGGYKNQLSTSVQKISLDASNDVNSELSDISDELFVDLNGVKRIKVGLTFNVEENISDVIIEKDTADGDIKLDSQGDGMKKQIWMSFIKWKSLQKLEKGNKSKKFIWCFDEPEIHLYPAAQRNLFSDIKKISKDAVQSFICTHSTVFIDKYNLSAIKQLSLVDGYSEVSSCSSVSDVHQSLGVKNSDILFYDKFFVVEGATDNYLIPAFYKLYFGKDMSEDNIQIIDLKGKDNRLNNSNIFNQILKDFKKNEELVYYFFDGDSNLPASDNLCIIGEQDLEDSIKNDVWIEVINNCCGFSISDEDLDGLRNKIGTGHNEKFHKLLSDFIFSHPNNVNKKYLPSKGDRLSSEILKVINKKEQIPQVIQEFFSKIKI